MEHSIQEFSQLQKFLHNFKKKVFKIKNKVNAINDLDFKIFKNIEYKNVSPQEITSLKHLIYLKNIDLEKKGFITHNLNELIAKHQLLEKQSEKDQKIIPIGNIEILDNSIVNKNIIIGYNSKNNKFYLSYNKVNNLPIWNPYSPRKIKEQLHKLHPLNSSNLQFKRLFFKKDIQSISKEKQTFIQNQFNAIVVEAFKNNKYFQKNVQLINLDIFQNKDKYLHQNIKFDHKGKSIIGTVNEINKDFISIEPLIQKSNQNNIYLLTPKDIQHQVNQNNIQLISKLNSKYYLGQSHGELKIGTIISEKGQSQTKWYSMEQFLSNENIPLKVRNNIHKNVIFDKNFFLESESISLNKNQKSVEIKKHFQTQKYFITKHIANNRDIQFEPLNKKSFDKLVKEFNNDKNYHKLNQISKYLPKDKKKEISL
ncbi:hypothetical protein SAMN04489761_3372 [Tenacibaculum sp. MAR_2009_124]|uniref:hypothetical protein n=1 Tax=Tenacibaculum sp. MAR_2009_124 TaxID=1250059 RepID=UPI00089986D7|nr:hypothetical protein [Tenacibaculum sp. MAR_2009_124]SEC64164.1 hypothetical protein SAMN04489761_3372 [Tenacibaculum sp. MAR_2009_124]